MPHRLTHTIRQIEQICPGCWAVSTQTEDGHRFTAFGVTRQQAMYRAHHQAQAYGRYAYPAAAGPERKDAVRMPHDQVRRVRNSSSEPATAPSSGHRPRSRPFRHLGTTPSRAPRTR